MTLLLGKIIPLFGKWLPVIFHKLLIWLLSVRIELEGEVNTSNDCNLYEHKIFLILIFVDDCMN